MCFVVLCMALEVNCFASVLWSKMADKSSFIARAVRYSSLLLLLVTLCTIWTTLYLVHLSCTSSDNETISDQQLKLAFASCHTCSTVILCLEQRCTSFKYYYRTNRSDDVHVLVFQTTTFRKISQWADLWSHEQLNHYKYEIMIM